MSEATLGTPPAAAPAAPSQPSPSTSQPAASDAPAADAKGNPPPEPRPHPSRNEVRRNAAKELRTFLDEKHGKKPAEAKPEGDAPKGEPKAGQAPEQGKGEPKGQQEPVRGADGKFAPKEPQQAAAKAAPAPAGDAKPAPQQPLAQPPRQDGELEGRLARTVRELNNTTAQVNDYKRKHESTAAENTQLKSKLEAAKQNPLDLLEELGWNYEKLTQGIVEKGLRPRAQRAELPPEVKQQLDELNEFKQRVTQREQTAAEQAQRTRDVTNVRRYIEQNAEQFPFSSALEWAADAVLDNTMAAKQADALPFLRAFEQSLVTSTVTMMGNERALRALLKSKPELRESLIAALGISKGKEADPPASDGEGKTGAADGPRSVSSLPSGQTPPPSNKPSKRERKAEAVRAFQELRRSSAGG